MRNDLNGMIADIDAIDAELKALKTKKDKLTKMVSDLIQSDIKDQIGANDYGCGTATIETEEFKLKAVVSRKVTWNQDKLADIHERIKASGENPLEYLKVKYDVHETKFKNWPSVIQDEFLDARTVEPSTPALKIERKV
jgi:hypothetical protein